MAKNAFLFPGQASQQVGMGMDLVETYPESKAIFEQANEIMGFDLAAICFQGPEDELKQTRITQPAIFVHSMAVFEMLKKKSFLPQAVAGHSLGEYSALVAAGAFDFATGLRLVKIRGELMQQAGQDRPGTMAAIIGLEYALVEEVCKSVASNGIVCPANFNSPGQVVISGEIDAVHAAMETAKDKGAKKVVELVVGGAFHSPLMESAQQGLGEALGESSINNTEIAVYTNVMAKPTTSADEIRELLLKQLLNPVRWVEIVQNMVTDGTEIFYEIGPGKVLSGLNRRIDREKKCVPLGSVDDIEAL